jgi:hypothetical protein
MHALIARCGCVRAPSDIDSDKGIPARAAIHASSYRAGPLANLRKGGSNLLAASTQRADGNRGGTVSELPCYL